MSLSNTLPVRKRALLSARSNSLRYVSAAEHHTAEPCSKTGRTKPRKHLPRSDLSWNTRQDFKIPSLWEATQETNRRCFSKVILESNVTPNIPRSSDSFSTVPSIVNVGDLGCIVNAIISPFFIMPQSKLICNLTSTQLIFQPCSIAFYPSIHYHALRISFPVN